MSVTVRPYRTGGWEVDITTRLPNGIRHRERPKSPVSSKSGSQRWGEDRERHLLQHGPTQGKKEVPTLEEFGPRFLDGHARANRQKPSGISAKETILRVHLVPMLGAKRLDGITTEDIQQLKVKLNASAPKTVNNVLTTLNMLLKKAVEWAVIDRVPCVVRLLKIPETTARFHDFEAYKRLVAAAQEIDATTHLLVLLGGEAGLRCGEMMGLRWEDVNLSKRQLCVERSIWKGHVTATKGGRSRFVPLTKRLTASLQAVCGPQNSYVLSANQNGLTQRLVQGLVRRAALRSNVPVGVHILRHTFCSHLAMRGAPASAIQELAGHKDLSTTQRYMHLSPAAIEGAIRLLDQRGVCGDIPETPKF